MRTPCENHLHQAQELIAVGLEVDAADRLTRLNACSKLSDCGQATDCHAQTVEAWLTRFGGPSGR